MKKILFMSCILAAFAPAALAEIPQISVKDAEALRGSVQFVDIREEEQFIGWDTPEGPGGHITGAMDFPLSWLDTGYDAETVDTELTRRGLKKDVKTILYDNGPLAQTAYDRYKTLGFANLFALDGGYKAWSEAKLPTDRLAHYELLVSPRWVEALVEGKKPFTFKGGDYKIFEIFVNKQGREDYLKGHIPGAVLLDDRINQIPGPRTVAEIEALPREVQLKLWNRPSDEVLEERLEALGVTTDTTVILYGNIAATTAAYRAGAVMRYAGVKDVRFINGGRPLWLAQKRPLEAGDVAPVSVADFGTKVPAAPGVIIDYAEELKLVNNPDAVIASIRSWPEYRCEVSGYTYIGEAGDIANGRFGYAGSNPYAMEDYRNLDNTMCNADLIAARWKRWGIVPEKIVSFHCGTGWRASETYFAALAMGWPRIMIYDGGWYEWHKIPDSPRKQPGLPADAPEQAPQSFFKIKK